MPQRGQAKVKPRITKTKSVIVDDGKSSVTYLVSITKNTGNFGSLKIQAGITLPLGASDETLKNLEDLMVVAREKVVNRISEDIDEISNTL